MIFPEREQNQRRPDGEPVRQDERRVEPSEDRERLEELRRRPDSGDELQEERARDEADDPADRATPARADAREQQARSEDGAAEGRPSAV